MRGLLLFVPGVALRAQKGLFAFFESFEIRHELTLLRHNVDVLVVDTLEPYWFRV